MFRKKTHLALFATSVVLVLPATVFQYRAAAYQKPESAATAPSTAAGAGAPKSLAGRWVIVPFIVGQGQNAPMFLIDVTESDQGGLAATVVDNGTGRQGWIVKSISSVDGKLHIEFEADSAGFTFDGTGLDAFARGELVMPRGFVAPTRVWPTMAPSIEKYVPPEEEHRSERMDASKAEGDAQISALMSFAEKYPQSPLALDACLEILRVAKRGKIDPAIVEKAIQKYLELAAYWGPHLVQHSRIAVAEILSDAPQLNSLALQSITAAESALSDADPASWKRDVEVIKGYTLIRSAADNQRKQGAEILWKHHEENIFDTKLAAELLNYEQTHGDLDKAIALAAQFAAFPPTQEMNEQWNSAKRNRVDVPGKLKEQVSSLWVKKHGSTQGLEKRLDEAYLRALKELKATPVELSKDERGNRVVVVELFTGAACPPCLAVDMALSNLGQSFSATDVAVLRYQQNSPLPDPMANLTGEMRARYYSVKGTPTAFVDGAKVDFIDGFRERVPQVESVLRDAMDADLKTSSDIGLTVSAENQGGILFLTAETGGLREMAFRRRFAKFGGVVVATSVFGVLMAAVLLLLGPRSARSLTARLDAPWFHALLMKRVRIVLACGFIIMAAIVGYQLVPNDQDVGDLRLRMAVTEDDISFAAPNGVRIHEGVVRAMPAGFDGIGPTGGKIAYSGRIDLSQFRQQLIAQIATIETNMSVKFAVKPLELRHLNFVAFVQSESSKEILQAASVPVDGFAAEPTGTASPQPKQSTPASSTAQPVAEVPSGGEKKPASPGGTTK